MTKETWKLMDEINKDLSDRALNLTMIRCAPFFTGMKPSVLLTIGGSIFAPVIRMQDYMDFEAEILFTDARRQILFLYREKDLTERLREPETERLMRRYGYDLPDSDLGMILPRLRTRYDRYMRTREDFPHEIGLLLGYPAEDVRGFVEHQGEDYRYNGYWKVYGDVERAKEIFAGYAKAEEWLLRLITLRLRGRHRV